MEEKRIYIRKSIFADCEYFARWEAEPAVTEFFTIDAGRDYEETVREYVERENDPAAAQFTICAAGDDRPLGRIYVSNINRRYDSLDITRIYIAEPAERGRGCGRQALIAVLRWAFEEEGAERVTLDYFTDNKIAAALYEKLGFKREGIMRRAGKKDGRYVDLCLASMLRSEFTENILPLCEK